MEPWYKQLDFEENPLDARPNAKIIGLEEQEAQLKNLICKEQLCFLHGLTGAGKTSLLKRVQESLADHTFIYLDADAIPAHFDLTAALQGKRNFLDRIRLREMPEKKPVLIIDEFQATDPRLVLEARSCWENPNERHIKSIVIAQISDQLKNVPGSFKDRLGNRIISLPPLTNDAMKHILQVRLHNGKTKKNYYDQLSPQTVQFLVAVADGNARRLLEFTEMLFEYHYQRFQDRNPIQHKPDYKIQYPAAKEILTVNNIPIEGYEQEKKKKVKQIKSVKESLSPAVEKEASQLPVIAEQKESISVSEEQTEKQNSEQKQETVQPVTQQEVLAAVTQESESLERVSQTFDKEFSVAEQNVLRALLRHERMTLKQLATNIHLEINKCNGVIANLKKKNAIVPSGKLQGDKGWQITPSAKRAMVTK